MKIAIIGANGFIGQSLTELLLKQDCVSSLALLDTEPFPPKKTRWIRV